MDEERVYDYWQGKLSRQHSTPLLPLSSWAWGDPVKPQSVISAAVDGMTYSTSESEVWSRRVTGSPGSEALERVPNLSSSALYPPRPARRGSPFPSRPVPNPNSIPSAQSPLPAPAASVVLTFRFSIFKVSIRTSTSTVDKVRLGLTEVELILSQNLSIHRSAMHHGAARRGVLWRHDATPNAGRMYMRLDHS